MNETFCVVEETVEWELLVVESEKCVKPISETRGATFATITQEWVQTSLYTGGPYASKTGIFIAEVIFHGSK